MIASVHMVLSNKTGSRRHRVHSGGGDGGGGIRWWGAGHWGVLVVTLVVMVGGGRWRSVVGDIVCWWGIVVVRRCWSLRKVDLKQFRRISRDVTDCDKGLAAVKKTGSGALPP